MTPTIVDAMVSLSAWIEVSVLTKATLMLALGLAAARVATHAQASVRHLLLTATFGTLIALPLIALSAPPVTIPVRVSETRTYTTTDAASADGIPDASMNARSEGATLESRTWTRLSWVTMVRWGWIAGTAALSLSLLAAVSRICQMRRNALPRTDLRDRLRLLATHAGIRGSVDLLEHEDLQAPLTCGLWRPAILLPVAARDWDEADVERALIHELEHVLRGGCARCPSESRAAVDARR